MAIFYYQIKIYLQNCHSLKEKRSVLKSFKTRLQKKFNISIAEIGYQEIWQTSLIGIVWLSEDVRLGNSILNAINKFMDEFFPNIMVDEEFFERR
ncbi:MAG TPA: DUF503 domain-containing protein [Anaerovoracaceae bacterium]|nr:DUF503 domain-containing protein [Anaerovoracaceae bacterium]